MSKRRGNGDGAIFKDGDRWVACVEVPTTDGRRKRRKRMVRTYAEARIALADLKREAADAEVGITGAGRLSVAAYLDSWLTTVVPGRVSSPNTIANYRWAIGHIVGDLGAARLSALTPEDVDRLLASKAAAGLSRNTVTRIRSVLADALRHAERRGLVGRNVAALAVLPHCKPPSERRSLTAAEGRALLASAADDRLSALVVCGLLLGLRPGELPVP